MHRHHWLLASHAAWRLHSGSMFWKGNCVVSVRSPHVFVMRVPTGIASCLDSTSCTCASLHCNAQNSLPGGAHSSNVFSFFFHGGRLAANADSVADAAVLAACAGFASTTERVTEKAAEAMEDAAEDTVKQLHPAFTKFINR